MRGPGGVSPTSLAQRLAPPSQWPKVAGSWTVTLPYRGGGPLLPEPSASPDPGWMGTARSQALKPGSLCPRPPTGPVRAAKAPTSKRSVLPRLSGPEAGLPDGASLELLGPASRGQGVPHPPLGKQAQEGRVSIQEAPAPASPSAIKPRILWAGNLRNKTQAGACLHYERNRCHLPN